MKPNPRAQFVYTIFFMIPLFLFWIIPLIMAFGISFTDWDYISPAFDFVGLDNYRYIFNDSDFFRALWNTFVFAIGSILPTMMIGLSLALLLYKNFKGCRVYQLVVFSPWITPTVAVSLVWSWIFEPEKGLLNYFLGLFSIAPLEWLKSSDTAMLAVVIFTVWKSVGWTMLFYLGALERVPESTYEAATLDGCSTFNKFLHITLPLISPTTFFLGIINLIASIQVYDQIQIMTQGGPGGSTTTLLYLYYQKAFQNYNMGEANAVAMVILLIIVVLSLISTWFSKKHVHYD
ncbi:carbohydrate ABC transporter permease [Fusibacter ferrireducens]|uniref:Sugar ABC transporter permease n=1 Tax=Fusibacter ferrireducens TaxID=2785058 RepID=A0ABR9ZTN2_9FIRM|nr:sugar ABC transporter permease [Fusibacter ferrireducens]MBF4693823.1 sugar ABC transporter permease [Fusibacter ferrireducens]